MTTRNYWLDLFTWTTWQKFQNAGASVSGFRESRCKTVQQIKPGDYLLCYLTGISRWIGVLEVISSPFRDNSPIWHDEDFPCRLKVKVIASLTPETAVPVLQLKEQLSILQNLKNPNAWTGYFRGSPAKWNRPDGEAVVSAILEAQKNPIVRPVDPIKLGRRPTALKAKIGAVTVPQSEDVQESIVELTREPVHAEIQWLLLKLGSDMGFNVWVARNDRSREWQGNKFSELPRLKQDLPVKFDEATRQTIEYIDVLWLEKNRIVAAFEVESTTSIYSGLLRMADLIAMQPNLTIPLFLAAPEERRDKVIAEVNRPVFSGLKPPMREICRYISFSALRNFLAQAAPFITHMKPDVLGELSESCEIEDA